MRELPLFPLHSVLCPGIALPLHIFETRYREMVGHCLETGSPFGVVLIRDGREVGPAAGHIADVGTTAVIRRAGRYPDGRLDIVTVGEQRFRIRSVDSTAASYLVGLVEELDEPIGAPQPIADRLAEGVGRRFLAYLEQLQPPEPEDGAPAENGEADSTGEAAEDRQRREQLMASARRLIASGDATAVSYLLTGLVQLDLSARQALLEIPDTASRLRSLEAHLSREQHLLSRHLRPMALDLETLTLRRN
jgi:Lon protease-like protein